MVARNITFSLPADLLKKAKVYAAEHDTTVNALVRELLREKLEGEKRARAAARQLVAIADRGPYFSVDLATLSREDLNER